MRDRIPGAPGQYKAVIAENQLAAMQAGEQFVITLVRDDQPVVEGTPYNKESVLPEELARALCPDIDDPTPADALAALLPKSGGDLSGPVNMEGNALTGVPDPINSGDAVPLSYLGKLKSSRQRVWISSGGTVTVNLPTYNTDYEDGILIVRAGNPVWTSVYIYSGAGNGNCRITPVVEDDKIIVFIAAGGVLSITSKVGYDLNFHVQLLSL